VQVSLCLQAFQVYYYLNLFLIYFQSNYLFYKNLNNKIIDFRSPQSGIYANLEKYNLPYAEAIFDIEYF